MAERKSIYIGAGLARALDQQELFGGKTGMVNVIGDRYAEICRIASIDLVERFWSRASDTRDPHVIMQELLA